MAYVVVWTVQKKFTTKEEYEDFFVVYSSFEQAQFSYRLLLEEDNVWCAAITKVIDATEPQWLDVSDGPTDGE